jgi:hypothetical protein
MVASEEPFFSRRFNALRRGMPIKAFVVNYRPRVGFLGTDSFMIEETDRIRQSRYRTCRVMFPRRGTRGL